MLHLTDQKEYEHVALNWYRKLRKRGCKNCHERVRGILTAWYGYIPKEMLDKVIENLKDEYIEKKSAELMVRLWAVETKQNNLQQETKT